MSSALLEITGLKKSFGGLAAVDDISFAASARSIVSVIGPNGAGKTTFFNLVTGLYRPDAGRIRFDDRDIVGLRPDQIARSGLARTFQNIRLFKAMTALENVTVGRHGRMRAGLGDILLHLNSFRRDEDTAIARARELLRFVGLDHRANDVSGSLPYGEQRRLEIARALAVEPKLVLLDEPSAGMNPQETAEVKNLICRMRDEFGLCVILIEHDMSLVMSISERISVFDYGRKLTEGKPAEIRRDARVIEAYLGRNA